VEMFSVPGGIGCQPGRFAMPYQGCQASKGYTRFAVAIERRAGTVAIASGYTRVKRRLSCARASRLGVRALPP
jgi:hypothetical protein